MFHTWKFGTPELYIMYMVNLLVPNVSECKYLIGTIMCQVNYDEDTILC